MQSPPIVIDFSSAFHHPRAAALATTSGVTISHPPTRKSHSTNISLSSTLVLPSSSSSCRYFSCRFGDDSRFNSSDDDDDYCNNEDDDEIECLTDEKTNEESSRMIRSKIRMEASLDSVWSVLTDYEKLSDFIPGLVVRGNPLLVESTRNRRYSWKCSASMAIGEVLEKEGVDEQEEIPRFNWVDVSVNLTEEQDEAITRIPIKMSKRCQALMKQIICFSGEKGSFSDLLSVWVRRMRPIRADWLSVLKELRNLESPFYIKVAEFSLLEDSFEANARDYTKIIHYYGKLNKVEEAERTLLAMKNRGFLIDQVTLTAMVQLYSKAGYHRLAEETFNEIKLLGEILDYRSYGSMIMAYIRAGTPEKGEALIREMDSQEICAGREVYKALLRAYSMSGDTEGAKRVFDAVQIAGIIPDVKLCGLLINAYSVSGESQNARLAFENMRKAGIKATDKCMALVLAAYEKEEKLNEALGFLVELEKDSIIVGKEASAVLAQWFKKLGVVKEVELLLREFQSLA